MKRSEGIIELSKALSKFQAKVQNPKMTAENKHGGYRYAPLSEVLNVCRPLMAEVGLSFIQDVYMEGENAVVTTLLMHESGEWMESSPLTLPAHKKYKDGKTDFTPQTAGSGISYAKRYQLQALMGIAADEDTDAEDVSHPTEPKGAYVPNNLVSSVSDATLKAKYQLYKGTLDGFAEYVDRLRNEKGYDNNKIDKILTQAIEDQRNQKNQQTA
jgi:ERF superfamily